MATLNIVTYDITDRETYAKYNPGALAIIGATLRKYGGEVLASSDAAEFLAGDTREMTIVLRFPSAEAAKAWHEDPEYVAVRGYRVAATTNLVSVLVEETVSG